VKTGAFFVSKGTLWQTNTRKFPKHFDFGCGSDNARDYPINTDSKSQRRSCYGPSKYRRSIVESKHILTEELKDETFRNHGTSQDLSGAVAGQFSQADGLSGLQQSLSNADASQRSAIVQSLQNVINQLQSQSSAGVAAPAPYAHAAPAYQAPAYQAPAYQAPAFQAPAFQAPAPTYSAPQVVQGAPVWGPPLPPIQLPPVSLPPINVPAPAPPAPVQVFTPAPQPQTVFVPVLVPQQAPRSGCRLCHRNR